MRILPLIAAIVGLLAAAGTASAQAPPLPTITLSITPTSLTVGGTPVSGAVTVTSTTTAKDSEPTLVRLAPGVTADQALATAAHIRDPNEVSAFGSIVFDAEVSKGATSTIQTVLQPGNYLALDTHFENPAKWTHAAFTVTAAAQPATLPAASATVHAIDFGFKAPATLHKGSVVRFQNDGYLVHMIVAIKARNAAGARRISALLKAGKDTKAEKLAAGFAGFMDPVSHGAVQQMTLDASPGYYVLACFMSTQDRREHTQLGMLRTVRITK